VKNQKTRAFAGSVHAKSLPPLAGRRRAKVEANRGFVRILAFSLALTFILSCVACGQQPSQTAASTTTAAPQTTTTTTAAPATTAAVDEAAKPASVYEKHLTISQTVLDAEKSGKTERDKYLFDKFNITFDLVPVTWGDWTEKVRAMVAGDNLPDLTWWDMKINHTAEYRGWATEGAFREITGTEKWPILHDLRTNLDSMNLMLQIDGKLYGWSVSRNNPPWLKDAYYPLYAYRRDWAKDIGMYKEGDAYTYDEIFAMIDAVKEKDPGGNGPGNTFGATSETWAFPGVFMEILGYGKVRSSYVKTDDGYVPYFTTTPWRQELKFVANMYRNGYIWKDQMVVGGREGLDNFKAGRSFMYLGNNSPGWFSGQYASWLDAGTINSTEDLAPMIPLSPADNKTFTLVQTEDYWTVVHFAYHVDDEKYERIMDLWEWLGSEEGRAYKIAGIEGKDYERISDTEIKILWEKDSEGSWISPYKAPAHSYCTPPAGVPSPNEGSNMAGHIAFEKIHGFIQTSPDYWVNPLDWNLNTFGGELFSQYGGFGTDAGDFAKRVLASTDDVDKMIDAWLVEMEPRWRPVADELNANLK
jgi:putative aldouronate transport system substrate-binding protein